MSYERRCAQKGRQGGAAPALDATRASAAHSVLAHMIHLVQTGRVIADGDNDLQARYSLPVPA